jgi:hypothetical protein
MTGVGFELNDWESIIQPLLGCGGIILPVILQQLNLYEVSEIVNSIFL